MNLQTHKQELQLVLERLKENSGYIQEFLIGIYGDCITTGDKKAGPTPIGISDEIDLIMEEIKSELIYQNKDVISIRNMVIRETDKPQMELNPPESYGTTAAVYGTQNKCVPNNDIISTEGMQDPLNAYYNKSRYKLTYKNNPSYEKELEDLD